MRKGYGTIDYKGKIILNINMFRKSFKVKTSTTIKGSERRRLRSLLENQYPSLTVDDVNLLISNKSEMSQTKAMTFNGCVAVIYSCGDEPVFFQIDDHLYPTIYTVWKFPDLLPTVTTNSPVLQKVIGGADLMAPGVIIDESTLPELRNLSKDDVCAVRIYGNKSAFAVGTAILSKRELCIEGIRGKAVTILHSYKDFLWSSGSQLDLPLVITDESADENPEEANEVGELSHEASEDSNSHEPNIGDLKLDENIDLESQTQICETDNSNDAISKYTMDDILFSSFMVALKKESKKISLPILTSTFYGTHVMGCCPRSLGLDIKKSKFKKLSVFLKKMEKEGFIKVKELTKGAESIVSINTENERVKSFVIDPIFERHSDSKKVVEKPSFEVPTVLENYKFPNVTELFVVSAQVKALFEFAKIRKGDSIPGSKVREILKLYVKDNSLQNQQNPREVILDPILTDCALKKNDNRTSLTWESLYDGVISKMPHAYEILFQDKDPVLKKGKLEPIDITIDTRTGNKKVTLIQNLETYGINPEKLARHVQVAVAASSSISSTQNGKGSVVLIQGNQVRYLQKVFIDFYKIPKKYIRGLEKALPKKK